MGSIYRVGRAIMGIVRDKRMQETWLYYFRDLSNNQRYAILEGFGMLPTRTPLISLPHDLQTQFFDHLLQRSQATANLVHIVVCEMRRWNLKHQEEIKKSESKEKT